MTETLTLTEARAALAAALAASGYDTIHYVPEVVEPPSETI